MSKETITENKIEPTTENKEIDNVNKLLNYINSSIEFTKNCIKDNLDRDVDSTNLNSQLKIYKRIKDKVLYYFELEEQKEIDTDIKDTELPF